MQTQVFHNIEDLTHEGASRKMSGVTHSSPGGPSVIMAAPNLKNKHLSEVKRLHFDEGMTLVAISQQIGIHEVTLGRWLKSEGLQTRQSGYTQRMTARAAKVGETKVSGTCRLGSCGKPFEDYEYRNRAFCSRNCASEWQSQNGDRVRAWCPCGIEIEKNPYQNLYCSPECRKVHGKTKQTDPANQVTFDCQNCGETTTRPRSWGKGYFKYCSNACARTHTKTKRHIMMKDADIVLEGSWEALVWAKLTYHKVPVERYDRSKGIEWNESGWYAPDFYVPLLELAVEVKGVEDPDDPARWTVFRERVGTLAVLDSALMDQLSACPDRSSLFALLTDASRQKE